MAERIKNIQIRSILEYTLMKGKGHRNLIRVCSHTIKYSDNYLDKKGNNRKKVKRELKREITGVYLDIVKDTTRAILRTNLSY